MEPALDRCCAPTDLFEVICDRSQSRGHRNYLQQAQGHRYLSFEGLLGATAYWIAWMEGHGISAGDRVALAISDPLDFAAAFLSCIAYGCWAVPLDAGAPQQAMNQIISRLSPSAVVSDLDRPRSGSVDWLVLPPVEDWASIAEQVNEAKRYHHRGKGGVVLMSSGSTGTPKSIELSQGQLLQAAAAVAVHHLLTVDDIGFCSLPLFHVNAEVVGLLATLVAGASLVVDDRFHREGFWGVVRDRNVTWINAVPAIVARLADPDADEAIPNGIRFVRSASAPLPVATLQKFETATGIPVLESYGMTEAAGQITANPVAGPRKPGSVGLPVGVELRVVTDGPSGTPEGPEDYPVGCVEIRGGPVRPSVFSPLGMGAPWLRTGDLGYLDRDGYLFLVGRQDDVINRGGEKMFPREIEEAIVQLSEVTGVVVVPERDPALGEVPVAYITVGSPGDLPGEQYMEATLSRIVEHIKGVLPRPKRPVALHIVERFPTTATGKVLRRSIPGDGLRAIVSRNC